MCAKKRRGNLSGVPSGLGGEDAGGERGEGRRNRYKSKREEEEEEEEEEDVC